MIRVLALTLAVALLGATCGPRPEPPTPPQDPPPALDAGVDACGRAEARLRDLGCAAGDTSAGPDREQGTSDDRTFSEECRLLEADLPGLARPDCIIDATSCEAADRCSKGE